MTNSLKLAAPLRIILLLGMTAVFAGYFMVWLPGPGAGLRLIGFEIGEWIKFLGVGSRRDLFYLPPIALGLVLSLWTSLWTGGRWQTWAARGGAILVSLLAFPAAAAITIEPPSEWLLRLLLIALVVVVALLSGFIGRLPGVHRWIWLIIALVAILGAGLPTWQYWVTRPVLVEIFRRPIGLGIGGWLNLIGFGVIALVAMIMYRQGATEIKKTG